MLALLLALAAGIAGYALMLALQRAPAATSAPHAAPEAPAPLPVAEPLPPAPTFDRFAVPASLDRARSATTHIALEIKNLPATIPIETAGIAVFAATSGAAFTWTPLSAAATQNDGTRTLQLAAAADHLIITLANLPAFAHHGYLTRAEVRTGGARSPVPVTLDATCAVVEFALPQGVSRAGPLCLHRLDDARWLPMQAGAGLWIGADGIRSLLLGAGTYVLSDPLARGEPQRFGVPADTQVAVRLGCAPVRVDRP